MPIRQSRLMADHFAQALKHIKEQQVDMIAITGDLLDVPYSLYLPTPGFEGVDPAYWDVAAEADYRLVRDLLDATALPYMVLPGNHDWDAVMWRVFDPQDNLQIVAGRRVVRFCDHEHRGNVPRRFHPQRTQWLDELARTGEPRQIHLQHYVITPELNEGYPYSYGEAKTMHQQIINSGQVELCLSGHYHRGTELIQDNGVYFSTCSAFCEAPYPWRIYEINQTGVTMTEHALQEKPTTPRPAVFLDRDGVINDMASYHHGPERMQLLPGAAQAIRDLNDAGFAVVVVTNQSCIGQGYVPVNVVHCVNDRMCRLLQQESGAQIDAVYYASGTDQHAVLPIFQDTTENKPNPTLLFRAQQELNLDLSASWMIGDRLTDAQAAQAANVPPILVRTGSGPQNENAYRSAFPNGVVTDDLSSAVGEILRLRGE